MKFLVVWWYNYNKKYHMVLVIRFLDKVILKKSAKHVWGIERSGFFNGREKWAKGFENQRV